MDNANSKEYLEKILVQVLENMKRTMHAPSVQMQDVPRESMAMDDEEEAALDDLDEDENPDRRRTQRQFDKHIEHNGELTDSEDEGLNEANGVRKHMSARKRRQIANYRNITDVNNDSGIDSAIATPQAGSSLPDADDEMQVDQASREEAQAILSAGVANGSVGISAQGSPQVATDNDVTMGEAEDTVPSTAAATVASPQQLQQNTPPESPPQTDAPVQTDQTTTEADLHSIKEEMAAEDAAVTAHEEGRMEREELNAEGEARTEAVAKAEAEAETKTER